MVPGGHERVLLADDESSIRTLAKQILEQKGYKVKVVSDGVEALELFRAGPDEFDLVVTDMGMPKMNGLQLSKEIRKIRSGTPIVICTGYSKQIDEEKYGQIGINALLIKPMTKNALTKTVRKALDEAKG
jgi:CheY-like chemotaxis protein